MSSPSLDLQAAIVSRLKADAAVTALIAGRVYDAVPQNAEFPYVSLGPVDELSDDADCVDGFDISLQVDCWSRAVGAPEAKNLSNAVRLALKGLTLPPAANPLVYFRHRQTVISRDPDGLTTRARMEFVAFIEQQP